MRFCKLLKGNAMEEKVKRLASLDALRGFDMFWIMGGDALLVAVMGLFGVANGWDLIGHVEWHGLHFEDFIFPTFLFMAGASFPFSAAKSAEKGMSRFRLSLKCLLRGFLLFVIGIGYNLTYGALNFEHFRVWSVLGRIGVAWMVAALLYVWIRSIEARIGVALAILVGTTVVTVSWLAPGAPAGADPFSAAWNLGCWMDRTLTGGHILCAQYDPEGFAGLVPSVVTAMLGIFAGEIVRAAGGEASGRKALGLVGLGLVCIAMGSAFAWVFPINKKLWSPSFVLLVGGCSALLFALFYWIVDVKGWRRWCFFFEVIGVNSITIYLAQRLIGFRMVNNNIIVPFLKLVPCDGFVRVVSALTYVALCWLFLLWLHRRKIFLKI